MMNNTTEISMGMRLPKPSPRSGRGHGVWVTLHNCIFKSKTQFSDASVHMDNFIALLTLAQDGWLQDKRFHYLQFGSNMTTHIMQLW